MNDMRTILGLAGSTRGGSHNMALLRAAATLAPADVRVETASIHGIPLYDGDLEQAEGIPAAVTALKERIAGAHALLLVTPEYNQSVPGVLKNALDWLSRPAQDIGRVFGGKPVAVMGASPGAGGTRFAQAALLPVLRALELDPWFGKQLYVAKSSQVFDANGALVDDKVTQLVTDFMAGFASFVSSRDRKG